MQADRPIAIALIFIVTLSMAFFLVAPEYNAFKSLQTGVSEKQAEFRAKFDYYAAIAKTHNDLQAHQDDIKKIDDALPTDPALGRLVYFLQNAAKENGLIMKDLFLSQSAPNGASSNAGNSVKDIVFSMDVTGDYASLENLIISLEKSARIFEVSSISFGSSTNPPYSFSLQIKTHSY